jgi:hypothetical protein
VRVADPRRNGSVRLAGAVWMKASSQPLSRNRKNRRNDRRTRVDLALPFDAKFFCRGKRRGGQASERSITAFGASNNSTRNMPTGSMLLAPGRQGFTRSIKGDLHVG